MNYLKKLCSCLLFCSITVRLAAQDPDSGTVPNHQVIPHHLFQYDSLKQRDLIDFLRPIFNRQAKERTDSSEAAGKHRAHFSGIPAAGYTLQTGFAGIIATNLAFYTSGYHNSSANVSSITASVIYSQYKQTIIPVTADIWTKDDGYNIFADWRYMKYPSTTFGLGGHTDLSDGYTIDFSYIRLHQYVVKSIGKGFYAGLGYDFDYFWNIKEVNPPAGVVTNFQSYGLKTKEIASGISLHGLYDTRGNPINPQHGLYVNVSYRPNFTFFGSDNNWQSLLVELRRYINFPSNTKNVLALWSYNWFTVGGKPPYLLLPSTGWDAFSNTGRGYIQGRYRGKNMVYFESEYRFGITPNGLLGAVVFANAQSFSRTPVQQLQTIAPGAGAGIRIKLNKFSESNLCIDYGWGTNGSRGFFVNLGEVF